MTQHKNLIVDKGPIKSPHKEPRGEIFLKKYIGIQTDEERP